MSDLPNVAVVFHDSFDGTDGGSFSRQWGDVDTSTAGQITVTASAENGYANGGAMVPPVGEDVGFGFGLYEFTLSVTDEMVGPYALLWPANDVWPGAEINVVEMGFGDTFSAFHWRNEDGSDGWGGQRMDDAFNPTDGVHTYAVNWQYDLLQFFVDGVLHMEDRGDVIGEDYAHGGVNSAPGIGQSAGWAASSQDGHNAITLYDFTYSQVIA